GGSALGFALGGLFGGRDLGGGLGFLGGLVSGGRDGGRRGLDRGDHEVAVGDGRLDLVGALQVGPADDVAQLVAGQVDDQVFRNVVGADLHLDRVADDFQRAALTEGLALVFVDE